MISVKSLHHSEEFVTKPIVRNLITPHKLQPQLYMVSYLLPDTRRVSKVNSKVKSVGVWVFSRWELRERSWRKRGCRKSFWCRRAWGECEGGVFEGTARVSCAKGNNGTHQTLNSAVSLGPEDEVPYLCSGTARLNATCNRRVCRTAPSRRTPVGSRGQKTKGSNGNHGLWICSREYQRAVRKKEITVPEGPI